MSLVVWQKGTALSSVCDADVAAKCLKRAPKAADHPGRVLKCLTNSVQRQGAVGNSSTPLAPGCKALLDIAEPPDEMEDYNKNLQARPAFLDCHENKGSSLCTVRAWSVLAYPREEWRPRACVWICSAATASFTINVAA
jgi:hypothetical protein